MARWSSAHASRYYHLLTHVADMGYKIIVLQPPSRGSIEANDIDVDLPTHPNVRVITVGFNRAFWNAAFPMEKLVKKLGFSLKALAVIKHLQREEQIDLLYLYNIPQFPYLIGRRPRVVFDLADDLLGMLESELSISPRNPLYKLAEYCLHWMFRRSDVVICISGPLYETISHPRKFIIPNGAPIPPASVADTGPRVDGIFTVGYVGAFEYSMALDQVVDAAASLPEVRFLLVGAGRDFPRIRDKTERLHLANVTLTGALSHARAMEMVQSMDVGLNLFHKTNVSHAVSPLKLFEYLSYAKPVISTRLKEVERVNEGFLYFADTTEELIERIRHIATHREEAAKMADTGRAVVAQKFAWPVVAREFLDAVEIDRRLPHKTLGS